MTKLWSTSPLLDLGRCPSSSPGALSPSPPPVPFLVAVVYEFLFCAACFILHGHGCCGRAPFRLCFAAATNTNPERRSDSCPLAYFGSPYSFSRSSLQALQTRQEPDAVTFLSTSFSVNEPSSLRAPTATSTSVAATDPSESPLPFPFDSTGSYHLAPAQQAGIALGVILFIAAYIGLQFYFLADRSKYFRVWSQSFCCACRRRELAYLRERRRRNTADRHPAQSIPMESRAGVPRNFESQSYISSFGPSPTSSATPSTAAALPALVNSQVNVVALPVSAVSTISTLSTVSTVPTIDDVSMVSAVPMVVDGNDVSMGESDNGVPVETDVMPATSQDQTPFGSDSSVVMSGNGESSNVNEDPYAYRFTPGEVVPGTGDGYIHMLHPPPPRSKAKYPLPDCSFLVQETHTLHHKVEYHPIRSYKMADLVRHCKRFNLDTVAKNSARVEALVNFSDNKALWMKMLSAEQRTHRGPQHRVVEGKVVHGPKKLKPVDLHRLQVFPSDPAVQAIANGHTVRYAFNRKDNRADPRSKEQIDRTWTRCRTWLEANPKWYEDKPAQQPSVSVAAQMTQTEIFNTILSKVDGLTSVVNQFISQPQQPSPMGESSSLQRIGAQASSSTNIEMSPRDHTSTQDSDPHDVDMSDDFTDSSVAHLSGFEADVDSANSYTDSLCTQNSYMPSPLAPSAAANLAPSNSYPFISAANSTVTLDSYYPPLSEISLPRDNCSPENVPGSAHAALPSSNSSCSMQSAVSVSSQAPQPTSSVINLASGPLRFTKEEVRLPLSLSFSSVDGIDRLYRVWDDHFPEFDSIACSTYLQIQGKPIPLKYWRDVYEGKAWKRCKNKYSQWKYLMLEYSELGKLAFWQKYSDNGNRLSFQRIVDMQRAERNTQAETVVKSAHEAFGSHFTEYFRDNHRGKTYTQNHVIVEKYNRLMRAGVLQKLKDQEPGA